MFFLAVIVVMALTHNLATFFPVTSNYLNQIDYFIEATYNQYMGYRVPTNPDPMDHSARGIQIGLLGLIGFIALFVLALFKMFN